MAESAASALILGIPAAILPAVPFIAIVVAITIGLVLSWLVRRIVLRLNRSKPELRETSRVARLPLRLSLCLIAVRIALATTAGGHRMAPRRWTICC